jgi:signal transduction histidine kinase/FixJ family two-component response regulator
VSEQAPRLDDDDGGRGHEPAPAGSPLDPDARAKVLIVDDDERNAFAAREALSELGHELVIARSGEEALKRLLAEDFALILLDLHMPGMDGYETAALIRARRRNSGTPILFLTAVFRDEAHLFQAYSAGAVDVVFKPVDPFILRSKVSVLVDLHVKTREIKRQADHHKRLLDENIRVRREKDQAQRTLERVRARQEAVLRSLPIAVHSRGAAHPFPALFVSDSVARITGFEAARFTGEAGFGLSRVHPDDLAKVAEALGGCLETGAYACEYRWQCADGTYRVFLDQGVLGRAHESAEPEIFGTILDATDRRSLEEQLAQARKMEAVGQLTGGVAHDFNNLLTVVLGNVDLLSRKADEDPKRARQLAAIRHAADRGRSLTRQLLAFSRRQQLNPQTLDVGGLIENFAPLLRQAVGEAITVETALARKKLSAHVDPAQLEAALLNLAVNARDAMSGSGTLTISTRLATRKEDKGRDDAVPHKGRWIVVEVKDTGAGMEREVLDRIFEPFFTTKEVGKGSGLGLSQVYGFVHQSGGHVAVDSRPGEGATFKLFLRVSEQAAQARAPTQASKRVQGGSERILVVEDDAGVLALAVEMLQELGYAVTTASDAKQALDVLDGASEPFDLLFTDVVMPGGMSGIELGRAARALRPQMPVLLASGFIAGKATLSDSEFPLIEKPYERPPLAAKLRAVLGPRRRTGKAAPGGETSALSMADSQ